LVLPYSARGEVKVLGKLELSPSIAYVGKTEKVAVKIKLWDTRSRSNPKWENHDVEIVDERGVVWWPYKGRVFEHPKDVKTGDGYMYYDGVLNLHYGFNATLSTLLPVVNHNVTFYLVVDGHKVAASRLAVVDDNPVRAVMSCKPAVVSIDDHTTCRVYLWSNGGSTPTVSEVYFGGKKVWPVEEKDGVKVEDEHLPFGSSQIAVKEITIKINDELANYYFGKPVYKTYLDKFAGRSYLIKAEFGGLGYSVSDVVTLVPCKKTDNATDFGLTLIEIGGFIRTVMSSDPVGVLVTLGVYGVKHENDIQWISEELIWGDNHFPQENDNNAIMGG